MVVYSMRLDATFQLQIRAQSDGCYMKEYILWKLQGYYGYIYRRVLCSEYLDHFPNTTAQNK